MRIWVTLGFLVITVVGALSAQSRQRPTQPLPNLVVFLTDTVRADHVSAHGYPRQTTPVFDALAKDGFWFENAYAPTSWTRPSVASLFTGHYPQRHGVEMRQDKLNGAIPTLAEQLQAAGMQTVCVTTNPHVTETWGMTRGFDEVVQIMPNPDSLKAGNDARVVYREVKNLIPTLRAPFFLYVHLIDPHYPYEPPKPDLRALNIRAAEPNTEARYDAELRHADRFIGKMMQSLEEARLLDDSVVVMTADHGEELQDHGHLGHGSTLYQEVVRVPLAISLPTWLEHRVLDATTAYVQTDAEVGPKAQRCGHIRTHVSLVDLMPTLLSLTGARTPGGVDGMDLTPLFRCEPIAPRQLFFSIDKEGTSLAAVLLQTTKLVVERRSGEQSLYVLDDDPQEKGGGQGESAQMRPMADYLATALESFEWSAQPGIHLELAGKSATKDVRKIALRLETTGRFVDLRTFGFEPEDRMLISEDGKTLRLHTALTTFWHRSPKHIWVQDRDELVFEIEPPDATLSVTVAVNGARARTGVIRFPKARSNDWPQTFTRADLDANGRPSLVDRRLAGVYLYAQQAREVEKVHEISQDIEGALKSLGYLQ